MTIGPLALSAPKFDVWTFTSATISMFTLLIELVASAGSVVLAPSETTATAPAPGAAPLAAKLPIELPENPATWLPLLVESLLRLGLDPPEATAKPGRIRISSVASRPTVER